MATVKDTKSYSTTLPLLDYFSPASFPLSLSPAQSTEELLRLFIHPARCEDLINLYRREVLQRLVPGLRKDGYSELVAETTTGGDGAGGSGSGPVAGRPGYYPDSGGPLGVYPANPRPNPIPSNARPGVGGSPFDIGRSDLDPLGGLGIPGGPAGGMLVGFDHPLFQERFGPGAANGGFGDPGSEDFRGGIGGLGEGMRGGGNGGGGGIGPFPPGSRYDPIGPGVRALPLLSMT